jgi:1-aminocyclopropane-1-carboxylate deaminase/D-cysteine desulfhydrase-like pyridoxal-dependent ACC family enzyme
VSFFDPFVFGQVGVSADSPLTPIENRGRFWFKRDDLYEVAGVCGGKARTCWGLAQGAVGLVTAGSRSSPQVNIVAHIAAHLGVPSRLHVPSGALTAELKSAVGCGGVLVQHRAGYNTVIRCRARVDSRRLGWTEIPFGMECQEAVVGTSYQVGNVPASVRRIVVPVGSAMSLAGVLWGLVRRSLVVPVVGVCVGADPDKRLNRWGPPGWGGMVRLVRAGVDYNTPSKQTEFEGVRLDSIYEAKCIPFLERGDLLWCVGLHNSEREVSRCR